MIKILKKRKHQMEEEIKQLNFLKSTLEQRLLRINSEISSQENILQKRKESLTKTLEQIEISKKELNIYEGIISLQDIGINYEPSDYDLDTISSNIKSLKESIGELINNNQAIITTRSYKIDGSEFKGEQFQKIFCENLLIGFNSYFNKKKKSITTSNYKNSIELIKSKFNKMNKNSSIIGVSINAKYLNLILQLLQLELDEKIAKAEEHERIKEEKRRLREQEKLLAEAEKAKLELQKQRRMYEQSLAKALTEQERQEFEAKLKEIDKREADVDYRINNSKAGYLYIAATKAMPDCCKLGVTRRLNPLVRLSELSSASVPFPFKCYGLVFSDDAFDLETKIHEYFDSKRVNKENKHKEFFYITPQEAIKVLKEEFGCDVHFVNEEESGEEK